MIASNETSGDLISTPQIKMDKERCATEQRNTTPPTALSNAGSLMSSGTSPKAMAFPSMRDFLATIKFKSASLMFDHDGSFHHSQQS
jgi:hypothetical protein